MPNYTLGFLGGEMFHTTGPNEGPKVCAYNSLFGTGVGNVVQSADNPIAWWVSRNGSSLQIAYNAGARIAVFWLGEYDISTSVYTSAASFQASAQSLAAQAAAIGYSSTVFIGPALFNLSKVGANYNAGSNALTDAYNAALASIASPTIGYIPDVYNYSKTPANAWTYYQLPNSNLWAPIASQIAHGLGAFLGIVNPGLAPQKLAVPAPIWIGMNVTLAGPYSTNRPYVNDVEGFEYFASTVSPFLAVPVNAAGYPLADFTTWGWAYGPAGTYNFSFLGTCSTVVVHGCATASSSIVKGTDGVSRMTVNVVPDVNNTVDAMARFDFQGVSTTDPINGLRLVAPDHVGLTTRFTPLYLSQIAHYPVLRMMETQSINNSQKVNASDILPDTATTQSGSGVSLKLICDLAKESGKIIWWNIYTKLTDAAILYMLTYFRDNYPAGRQMIIEYGNEMWNYSFGQYTDLIHMGKLDAQVMSDPKTNDGTTNNYSGNAVIVSRECGAQTVRVANLIKSIFPTDWGTRVIFVPPGSAGFSASIFQYIDQYYSDLDGNSVPIPFTGPKKYGHWLGVNFYLQDGNDTSNANTSLTANDLLTGMETMMATSAASSLTSQRDLAKQYGYHFVNYEGGAGINNPNRTDQTPFTNAGFDPRMENIVYSIFDQQQRVSAEGCCYYNGPADALNKYNTWSILPYYNTPDANSPKARGILRSIVDFGIQVVQGVYSMSISHCTALRIAMVLLKTGAAQSYNNGANHKLIMYSGTPPANAQAPLSGNVAISTQTALVYNAPNGTTGVVAFTTTPDPNAVGGLGQFYRLVQSDGVTPIEQGTFTATGGGGDMQANSTTIFNGSTVSTSSSSYTPFP